MELSALLLLLAFQVKHYLADYQWQFPYMYENKGKEIGWFEPLFDHARIHGGMTVVIIFFYYAMINESSFNHFIILMSLGIFDFVTHMMIDRVKAVQKTNPSEKKFWLFLGLDQFAHHTVGLIIVYIAITN